VPSRPEPRGVEHARIRLEPLWREALQPGAAGVPGLKLPYGPVGRAYVAEEFDTRREPRQHATEYRFEWAM
jgi:hypothetical protein